MEQSIDLEFVFSKAATIIKTHLAENGKRGASVVKFTSPTDLLKVIDFSLPNKPESHDKLLEYVKKVLEYSIQAGSLDIVSVAGYNHRLGNEPLVKTRITKPTKCIC